MGLPERKASESTTLRAIAAGLCLGLLAFLGDEVPEVLGTLILALTSTGAAWGCAAPVVGFFASRVRSALLTAIAVPLAGTVAYYVLILLVGRRWQGGYLEDGRSAATLGLISVARALAFWAAASVVAGVLFGGLGQAIRHGSRRMRSAAGGCALGMLAAQGWYTLLFWQWRNFDEYGLALFLTASISIVLSGSVTAVMLANRRADASWPTFALTTLAASACGVALLSQIATNALL